MTMILILAMQLTTATGGSDMLTACTDPATVRECAELRVMKAKIDGLKEVMEMRALALEALDVARQAVATANYWKARAQTCQDAAPEMPASSEGLAAPTGGPPIPLKPWCDSIGVPYNPKTGWCVAPKGGK